MTIRWTEAQNKCLIQLVKERTCLWLKSDPMHSSKKARDDSWLEIDQLLGTEGACRRFKSLRDDFTRWTKGTRKEYAYWEEMSFLKEQIGTRNRSRMKNASLPSDTTIELLDESDQSDGLYEEDLDDELGEEASQNSQSFVNRHLFIPNTSQDLVLPPETAKRPRLSAPLATTRNSPLNNLNSLTTAVATTSSTSTSSALTIITAPSRVQAEPTTDWQAPVDNTTVSREDYQYCKTIISAMSTLPKARQRKLKSQIYNLITDAVNAYEEEQFRYN